MENRLESIINKRIFNSEDINSKLDELSPGDQLYISSLPVSIRSIFAKSLTQNEVIILLPTVKEVQESTVELDILGVKNIVAISNFDDESLQENLTKISNLEQFIIISTYQLLKRKLPPVADFNKSITTLQIGSDLGYEDLIEYISLLGYQREKFVDQQGDFAVRGSIIDFWSYSEKYPSRIEYDGDFLESIRLVDFETQRSLRKVEQITIASLLKANSEDQAAGILNYLKIPIILCDKHELDLISVKEQQNYYPAPVEDIDEDLKQELFELTPEVQDTDDTERSNNNVEIEIQFDKAKWIIEDSLGSSEERINFDVHEPPTINSKFEILFTHLYNYAVEQKKVIITVENELQAKRLKGLLVEHNENFSALIDENIITTEVFPIRKGFLSHSQNLIVLSDYNIFNKPYRTKVSKKKKVTKSRSREFASLKVGDFIVHENFGIGMYDGLKTIKIGLIEQESIKIRYAESGVVYVNLNYLGLVKKFASKDSATPKLSVLGSTEWKSTKKKVKAKIKEASRELIKLYAKRKASIGIKYSSDSIWQKELEASFMYEDTVDQVKVTDDVKMDMESQNPMDRLVCGDVGFGKTEIAVRAAFKAINDNKQVAMLVPTTILAEQHHTTFRKRLSQFPVKVSALSRFQNKAAQTEIIKNLKEGKVDIIIGTHRLLSKDVEFNNLGLLIIDEEHRFGVMTKEKLRAVKANVDTLTLTATPIPRTLNLSLLGARDLSIIATPPPNRQPIYTKVDKFEIKKVREWILKEINRNGQVYFVHDRVQSIEKISNYLAKYIPEIKIAVAHGQMKASQLEKIIYDFLNHKYHVLISTKIIESGLDIPNVNTIIINRADRFGLAELHQLRGRVGRSDRQAFAYLLVPSLGTITKKAVKRLQAIEEYTELGEGFNLSMRDLEIRGAGNLLGTEQSGAINTVGFDLYVKLLDQAVDELKQDEFKEIFKELPKQAERSEPSIDTYFEIGIPAEYMSDQSDRLGFYSALFSVIKVEEILEIKEEMLDRFGKFPAMVDKLILIAVLRFYASFALFERIIIQKEKIILILPKGENEEFYTNKFTSLMKFINNDNYKKFHFVQTPKTMKIETKNNYKSPEEAIKELTIFCQDLANLYE